MDITGKYVAVLVDNYFEQAEFEEPISALKDAGAEVTVIAVSQTELQGMNHVELGDTFQADLLLAQADSDDYDALVLPGGVINADHLRVNETAQQWVVDFLDANKPLAVICHAPWLLVSADVLEGRRLTSYHTLQDDIINAGGDWVNEPVVIDRSLITSRQPDDLPEFNRVLITTLNRRDDSVMQGGADTITGKDEMETEENSRLRELGYDKNRDEISEADERDILADENEDDPDELHPSDVVPADERDNND